MKLSVVVPAYNEEAVLPEFFNRMQSLLPEFLKKYGLTKDSVEIIFVNDGSTDNTLNILKGICLNNDNYKLLNLSRNYGHQIALTAGLEHSRGEAVVIMDADLQDPPEFIFELYDKFLEGYDVVNAVRAERKGETFFKLVTARVFYRVLKKLTNVDIPVDTGDFRLISRRVADALGGMKEKHRFVRGMISWVGFNQTSIPYVREERFAGETKYPLRKMLKFALDGITSFSSIPLRLSSYLGFLAAFLGFLYSLDVFYVKFFTNRTVPGWTSLIVVVLFLGGVQLICLGMIGEYLSRMSDETKNRPLYLLEGIYGRKPDQPEEQNPDPQPTP